jgi:hypothetical protein
MNTFEIVPTVDQTQEFIEIANDFSNPLEVVREAISNSFDANASEIHIAFDVVKEYGETVLQITITDNGGGMDEPGLQAFFDLGNSLRRGDSNSIGEKGHGTKVYFHSAQITVMTTRDGITRTAVMEDPFRKLHNREIPRVAGSAVDTPEKENGTIITIKGYNNNRREKFTHANLKDYVMWYTKFGSFENQFNIKTHKDAVLYLKGLDEKEPEAISFGHYFPSESEDINKLFDRLLVAAPDHFCKRKVIQGSLKKHPDIKYQAVFSIEGNKVKRKYNQMLSKKHAGAYTVQERYGVWLARDFIPVQRVNEWIGIRGTEFTRFHAFFNCQELKLTANRGSVMNTPDEILQDIEKEIRDIYNSITDSDDWRDMEWLESQASGHRSTEREKKDFEWRKKKVNKSNVAEHKGYALVEPATESGVFGLVVQLSMIEPELFPFSILDYNTHSGYDLLVKGDHTTAIHQSRLYYVELKNYLTNELNHSFANLHSIVCWDTKVAHGEEITDINNETRTMKIAAAERDGEPTRYLLDHPNRQTKVEVFVLKHYLKEKCGIEFQARSDIAVV